MIRRLDNRDRELCMVYIRSHEHETTFLHGNVLDIGLENDPSVRRCADYFGWFETDPSTGCETLHGILPFYNLGSCIPHWDSNAAVEPFLALMRERPFEVLLGMRHVVEPFVQGLEGTRAIRERDDSWYMVNRDPVPFFVDGLTFRLGDAEDEEIVRFINDCSVRCLGNRVTLDQQRTGMRQNQGGKGWLLGVKDGRYVSMACLQSYTDTLQQIGGVATPAAEQGKGYCKATVYEMCRRIRANGHIPSLFVVQDNEPAVRAYRRIGFERTADYLMVKYE